MEKKNMNVRDLIPEHELKRDQMRSSGPGGQNVNRRESAVRLRWSPEWNHNLTEEEKVQIEERLRNEREMKVRLQRAGKQRFDYQYTNNVEEGKLLITAHEGREQGENWEKAVEKFYSLLEEGLKEDAERRPLKTPRKAKERRLEEKHRKGQKKESRRKLSSDSW